MQGEDVTWDDRISKSASSFELFTLKRVNLKNSFCSDRITQDRGDVLVERPPSQNTAVQVHLPLDKEKLVAE